MKYSSWWLVVGLGWTVGLSSVGCSSSDSGSTSVSVPLDQLPQKFSSALCDAVEPCCKTDDIAYSASKCKQEATRQFTDLVTSNTGIGAGYDPNAAGDCLSSMLALSKRCITIQDDALSSACQRMFFASFPTGAYCLSDEHCASHRCEFGRIQDGTGRGLCSESAQTTAPPAQLGEPCDGDCYADGVCPYTIDGAGSGAYCHASDGLFCSTDTATCASLAAVGEDCSAAPCALGAYCDGDGVCEAQRDSGPCVKGVDMACSSDSYCNAPATASRGECVSKRPDGYACDSSEDCKSGKCNLQGICGPGSAATEASCVGQFLSSSAPAPD